MGSRLFLGLTILCAAISPVVAAEMGAAATAPEIRTPRPAAAPRINAVPIFGVRPGNPFLYRIPATGERPITFSADGLPSGLTLDPATGQITGTLAQPGEYVVTLHAKNTHGADAKRFKIVVGETIALTPPMGWNSWNHYASRITGALVLANARAMADSGLIDHGWTYVNIDDTWQGARGGEFHAIQGNEKFPDMKGLCDAVHALGLKIGIYSTPWVQSYAGHIGGSAMNPEGTFTKFTGKKQMNRKVLPWAIGTYSFAPNDARQWGAWGIDYLKYDWNPNELPETKAMYDALRASGRDIAFSLSNSTPIANIPELDRYANSWRIYGDIKANWKRMVSEAEQDEKWAAYQRPGHWNDPDMLEIGTKEHNQPGLTPDEEYTHMTWWCLLSAPLLLGNDLTAMDPFTLGLLTNDEVIAVDQDELGRQARPVARDGDLVVYAKPLADGGLAVGLFNLGSTPATVAARWSDLKLTGRHAVRDLWRQKNLGTFSDDVSMPVAPHSAELVKISR
ncbi:MAG TPA: putative Ig domain-containing protein [Opitutaceae bacterium]|nr:putative Ig domain-containing protein [Opitutaceae bacterium]